MKRLDKEIEVTCEICDREFIVQVDSNDYDTFRDPTNTEFMENLFPYLPADEVFLLATGVCHHCE